MTGTVILIIFVLILTFYVMLFCLLRAAKEADQVASTVLDDRELKASSSSTELTEAVQD
jgi:hypothetical protein